MQISDQAAKEARAWARRHQSAADVEACHRRRVRARRFQLFDNDDGMTVVHGEVDPVTGEQIRKRIAAETDRLFHADGGRGAADEVRTPEQRRADAFANLMLGGDSVDLPPQPRSVPVRHHVIVIATAEAGEITDGRLVDGTALPQTVLERLACGSDLIGTVFSAAGEPLWMGRATRLATDTQWRALIARDGGCGICGADPSRCEAHHLVPWRPPAAGPTDIDNLVLLCRHHHHLVHDLGWGLGRTGDGEWALEPP